MCISYCVFQFFSMFFTCCPWKFSIYSVASCTVTFRVSKTTCDSIEQLTTSLKGKVALIFLFAAEAHAQLACTWMHFADIPLVWKTWAEGEATKANSLTTKIARNKSGFIFKILKKKAAWWAKVQFKPHHLWSVVFCLWKMRLNTQNLLSKLVQDGPLYIPVTSRWSITPLVEVKNKLRET